MAILIQFFQLPTSIVLSLSLLILLTSAFVKVALIFSIFFFGLGIQGSGGRLISFSLAIVCTFFLSAPSIERAMLDAGFPNNELSNSESSSTKQLQESTARFLSSWKSSLNQKLTPGDKEPIHLLLQKSGAPNTEVDPESWRVIAPTFILKELSQAFSAGFKILLPFLVIDLLVAYLFGALDIRSLHAQTVSVPLKIMAFVSVDGLQLLTVNLLQSIQV